MASTKGTNTINLSEHLFKMMPFYENFPMPPRILNQHCGLLSGADILSNNTYAYRIIAKIKFSNKNILTTKTVEEMFPGPEVDSLYKNYSYAMPKLTGLYG